MLFDIIRDWFVQYIWGGMSSSGDIYSVNIGQFLFPNGDTFYNEGMWQSDNSFLPVNIMFEEQHIGNYYISFGDWLSTTSTIIVLIFMCLFLFICVRYLFKVGAGLFSNLRG